MLIKLDLKVFCRTGCRSVQFMQVCCVSSHISVCRLRSPPVRAEKLCVFMQVAVRRSRMPVTDGLTCVCVSCRDWDGSPELQVSSLGPSAINKHKRGSHEGRRTGSHLINWQTRLQIRKVQAFITFACLLWRWHQSAGHLKESSVYVWIRISSRIIPGKCQRGGILIASCRVCDPNLDVITVCVRFADAGRVFF